MEMNGRRPIEAIGVRDDGGSSPPSLDRRAGNDAVVSPDSRSNAGDDPGGGLTLNDFVVVRFRVRSHRRQGWWNRKGDAELFDGRTRFSQQRDVSCKTQHQGGAACEQETTSIHFTALQPTRRQRRRGSSRGTL